MSSTSPPPPQYLYMKANEIGSIPEFYRHPKLPLLFAEVGHVLNRKGKPKKAIITVSVAGLFIFKTKMSDKRYKVEKEISTYTIAGLKRVDAKRREVLGKDRSSYVFICDHADEACSCLILARQALWLGLNERDSMKLEGLSVNVPPESAVANEQNITLLRYLTLCIQMKANPHDGIINLFTRMNVQENRKLVVDDIDGGPENIMTFVLPIVQFGKFDTIHFIGFAPYSVCRIAHFLLKKSKTITTIIFDSYQTLVPAQLRMKTVNKLRPAVALSFLFKRCSLAEPIMLRLVEELGSFEGAYQRLSFHTTQLTPQVGKELFKRARTDKCFSTLEVFGLDEVASTIPYEKIEKRVMGMMKHCRFLTSVSLSGWSSPLNMQLRAFVNTNFLQEIILRKQDMSQVFTSLPLPPCVHLLDLSECRFTHASLSSLLEKLAPRKSPLSLILANLTMPEDHWRILFDSFSTLPQIECLTELDWSGNYMPPGHIQQFGKYFFEKNKLRFLTIDCVFKSMSINDMQLLLSNLRNSSIWGLSIGGSVECNFAHNFRQLLEVLNGLHEVHILHLNGQKMTDSDAKLLLDFLNNKPCISEVSCDDSDLSGETKFYEFYENLLRVESIRAIGRPFMDIQRLFGRKLLSVEMKDKYEIFRKGIKSRFAASGRNIRSYFMCHPNIRDHQRFDENKYHMIGIRYPKCYFDAYHLESFRYGLDPDQSLRSGKRIFESLRILNCHESSTGLADLQHKLVYPPANPPRYPLLERGSAENVEFDESDASLTFSGFGDRNSSRVSSGILSEPIMPVDGNDDVHEIVSEMTRFGQETKAEEPVPAPPMIIGSLEQDQGYVIPALGEYNSESGSSAAPNPLPVFIPPSIDEPSIPFFMPPPAEEPPMVPVFLPPPQAEEPQTIPVFVPPAVEEPQAVPVFVPPSIEEPQTIPVFVPPAVEEPQPVPVFVPPPPVEEPQTIPVFVPPAVEEPPAVPVFVPPAIEEPQTIPVFVPPPVEEPQPVPVFTPPPPVEEPQTVPAFVPPPPVEEPPAVPVFVPPVVQAPSVSLVPPPVIENRDVPLAGTVPPPAEAPAQPPVEVQEQDDFGPDVPVSRVGRCPFTSAAGTLTLPFCRSSGSMPSKAGNTVKLANNEVGELSEQVPLEQPTPVGPREPRPCVEVNDVTEFSKNAVRSEVPPVQVAESQNDGDIDGFYKSSPVTNAPKLTGATIPVMTHPLMYRKKIVHPKVSILGVPSEW